MSNRATIQATKFTSLNDGFDGTTYGVRVYDDYGQAYDNNWESIPDNNMDILKKVLESEDETICGIIENVKDNKKGIYIGHTWYDWDDIKKVFEKEEKKLVCICGRCKECGGVEL